VSLGATRTFELKSKEKNTVISLPLEHGSLLLMGGPMQERWLHRVPKERAVRSPRINLTFRVIDATCGETPQR
jgi:alkylated DNA repair dioxygenase AlkB